MAAEQGLIGIVMTNVAPNRVAPGGSKPITGNNPIAFAIPTYGEFPFVLDMSLSNVAGGKLLLASKKGDKISCRAKRIVSVRGLESVRETEPEQRASMTFYIVGPVGFKVYLKALTNALGQNFSPRTYYRRWQTSNFRLVSRICSLDIRFIHRNGQAFSECSTPWLCRLRCRLPDASHRVTRLHSTPSRDDR